MKHIESIQPEYAAEELERIVREEGDATASAALSRLLHDWTGCAIPPTADTPQSEVEELVPLCLSILRRHWTTPLTALGDGTTPMSLADLLRRLIGDRVQGNEALGIPPANANIPTAVAALTKRHIDDGLTLTLTDGTDGSTDGSATTSPTTMPLPDGISLAQVLGSVADQVTELTDSNHGWTMSKVFPSFLNLKDATLNMKHITKANALNNINASGVVRMDELESITTGASQYNDPMPLNATEIYADNLETSDAIFSQKAYPNLQKVSMRKLRSLNGRSFYDLQAEQLTTLIVPELRKYDTWSFLLDYGGAKDRYLNLIHLEIGSDVSCNLVNWSPTTALAERLPEFLSNFKTYIAQRLTDKGSGLTLTLSQAVRDAIQQDPEIVSIITSKGWTISPAPSV